ncbi:hypothetical protein Hanom_Chr14g01251761 [Helianthus anomalus]
MCLCPKLDAKLPSSRGVSLEAASVFLRGRGKSSDTTLAFLLVGFTEYDDHFITNLFIIVNIT